jgi:chromatin remodeling complex protein RSC6
MDIENSKLSPTNTLGELNEHFTEVINTLSLFRGHITLLQHQIRNLEKTTKKKIKILNKELSKRKTKIKRKPSGFAQPTKISSSLCSFLEKPDGTQMARTEVTQHLISYIKKHNLQNAQNKRIIKPDEKLTKLLGISSSDELNYFNLQSFMNQHFLK